MLSTFASLSLCLSAFQAAPVSGPAYSIGDYDGDGLLDVYVVHPAGADLLFRNLGDGSFLDVTRDSGLGGLAGSRDALWQDFDGDGFLDLYVSFLGRPGRLFQNTGAGVFVDVSELAGCEPDGGELDAAWLDYDADLRPDLYVATASGDRFYRNLGQGRFEAVELVPTVEVSGNLGATLPARGSPAGPQPMDDAAKGPAGRRPRGPRGALDPVVLARSLGNPSSIFPWSGSSGSTSPLIAAPTACASGLRDAVSGGCALQASDTPTLGMLYPMSTALNVSASGNVGVGLTAPAAKLHVETATSGQNAITAAVPGGAAEAAVAAFAADQSSIRLIPSAGGGAFNPLTQPNDNLLVYTGPTLESGALTIGSWSSSAKGLRIDQSGNVGIGTTSPTAKLEVAGTARVTNTLTLAPSADRALDVATGSIYKGGSLFLHTKGGANNTASGMNALAAVTSGGSNTASGAKALISNTTGSSNTASGVSALLSNTTGNNNTASGASALLSNTTGVSNTASGVNALNSNTTGNLNTASGVNALLSSTTGGNNTASGFSALRENTTGNNNTASGVNALNSNTTGSTNTAIGFHAGYSLTTGDNNIAINNVGVAGESATIRIGTAGTQTRAFIAGIRGVTTGNADGIPVVIDSAGQLGTVSSSRRFKEEIRDMGAATERLLELRPVVFRYKAEVQSGERPLEYGLIAEEVAEVFPDLVVYDEEGRPFTVKYHLLSAMLLNELKKMDATLSALRSEHAHGLAELRSEFETRLAAVEARASTDATSAAPR